MLIESKYIFRYRSACHRCYSSPSAPLKAAGKIIYMSHTNYYNIYKHFEHQISCTLTPLHILVQENIGFHHFLTQYPEGVPKNEKGLSI